MTVVSLFQPSAAASYLYLNDFTTVDGTTKYTSAVSWALNTGTSGVASYLRETIGTTGTGYAFVGVGSSDMAVFANVKITTNSGVNQIGVTARYTNNTTKYLVYLTASSLVLNQPSTTVSGLTVSTGTWYPIQIVVKGTSIRAAAQTSGGTVSIISKTDSTYTTGNNGGVYGSNPSGASLSTDDFDIIVITASPIITVNGLLDGQIFQLYKNNVLVGNSSISASGIATIDCLGLFPNPPYDQIKITDVDGSTIIYTYSNIGNIFPSQTFITIVTQNPSKNPPFVTPLRTQKSRVVMYTKTKVYSNIIHAETGLPSGNALGLWKIIIPDPNRTEEKNFAQYERVWFSGKVGTKSGRLLKGVVDRTMPFRARGGYWALEIKGRDLGAFLDIRRASVQTTYTGKLIEQIILDTTTGPASLVPELIFGNYIQSTGITLSNYTTPRGMSAFDILRELAAEASTANTTYGVWVDQGELPGETGPNVHFQQIKQTIGLVPIVTLNQIKTIAPNDYTQVISRVTMGYDNGCFSDDTEVLSDNGWKLFDKLDSSDLVATVNDEGYLEYHKPERYIKYHYKGKMFKSLNKKVDLLVTPNHDMYIRTAGQIRRKDTLGFKKVNVSKLPKIYQYKRDAKWVGIDQQTININGLTFPTDVWLRFFGIWLAEGYTSKCYDNNRVGISQIQQDKLDIIEEWVKETGLEYGRYDNGIILRSRKDYKPNNILHSYLKQFGKCNDKFIPKELKNLPPERLRVLLDAMILGDGWHRKQHSKYKLMGYGTTSKRLAGDVQEIAIKAGYCCNICLQKRPIIKGLYKNDCYFIYITSFTKPTMPYDGKRSEPYHGWVDYDGFVYDVTVPNHTLLVRRNGKACWSGNSNGVLPNAYTFVDGFGPGTGSTYSGSFNGSTSYVSFPNAGQLNSISTIIGNAATITATLSSPPTNGNTLVLVSGIRVTGQTITSIVQEGVTWTGGGNGQQLTEVSVSGTTRTEIWLGTVGPRASTNITVTYSSALTQGIIDVCEYSNLVAASTVLDQTAVNTGTSGTTIDTGTTATTSQANELLIGAAWTAFNASVALSAPTNGFTLLDGVDEIQSGLHGALGFLEKIVSSTGTANCGVTIASSVAVWVGAIITLKASTTPVRIQTAQGLWQPTSTVSSIALEGWFYPTTVTGLQTLKCKGRPNADPNNANYGLRLNDTNIEFYYTKNGTIAINNVYSTSGTNLQANNWYYILAAYTFGQSNSITIYLGTNLANLQYPDPRKVYLQTGSWTTGTGADSPNLNPYPLTLGGVKVDGTMIEIFAGYMDNIKIYPRLIGATECLQHYQGTFPLGYTVLELYFEEAIGTTIVDSSGYQNNGTATNFSWFNYANVPNSQALYGIVARYFDRSYAGLAEATRFGQAILNIYRQPQRYVALTMPIDMRFTGGQWVYVYDKSFKGRALLKDITPIFDDNPHNDATILFI